MSTEDQEVEVELARSPATAASTTRGSLEGLEAAEQRKGRFRRVVGPTHDVEANGAVAELRLVRDPPGRRGVQAGDAADRSARERIQRDDCLSERPRGVAEVRPEADVGADPSRLAHPLEPYYPAMGITRDERPRRPIMVVGGGAFGRETDAGPLEELWLELAHGVRGASKPRVCVIATASGDDETAVEHFHDTFSGVADTSDLALFERTVEDIDRFLLEQDAIFVGGGNTASMLAVWAAHGVDRALRAAHEAGVVLAGRSAGGLCWFEGGTTDSFGPRLAPLHGGLGLISGSHCPHYDGEEQRRPLYHALVGAGELPAGIAVDDFAAAVFDGPDLVEVVAAEPGRGAYRVERGADGVLETPLPVRVLGGDG